MEYAIEILTREYLNLKAEVRELQKMSELQLCDLVGTERIKRLEDIEKATNILLHTTADTQN